MLFRLLEVSEIASEWRLLASEMGIRYGIVAITVLTFVCNCLFPRYRLFRPHCTHGVQRCGLLLPMFHGLFYNREPYKTMNHKCKKNVFLRFFILVTFFTFYNVFLFSKGFFIFKKRYRSSQRQADQQKALSKQQQRNRPVIYV